MKNPVVSVVMPAYNHEKYIGAAIESVLNQSFGDFEFIIVNDGSTDTTSTIISSYKDPRITHIDQPNADAYNALNRGLAIAEGKYIAIINSDDIFEPDRLEKCVDSAENADAVFIFSSVELIDSDGRTLTRQDNPVMVGYGRLKELYRNKKNLTYVLLSGNYALTTSNFFFSKAAYIDVGTFHPYRYAHDYDFILRVLKLYGASRFTILPDKLLKYRVHDKNTIKESSGLVLIETSKILSCHLPGLMHCSEDSELVEIALIPVMQRSGEKVSSIMETRSWKITKPLRKFAELIGLPPSNKPCK